MTILGDSSALDTAKITEVFDWEKLRQDMHDIKHGKGLTYKEIGEKCGCHMQSVYKFISGEYAHVGDTLRWRFVWFVREHWIYVTRNESPRSNISEARYAIHYKQHRLPGF